MLYIYIAPLFINDYHESFKLVQYHQNYMYAHFIVVDKNMATTVTSQPYNVILAGPFGVGKTFIFDQLREETIRYPTQKKNSEKRLDKWIHSARCGVDEIKVIKVGG